MELRPHSWERPLLALARQAGQPHHAEPTTQSYDDNLLRRAHSHARELTRRHSRSFYLASALLPPEKRRAARSLYAFCRVSDDIVDGGGADAMLRLARWRQRTLTAAPPEDDLVAVAWADTRSRFKIPASYAEQLLLGVERDLHQARYETFSDLAAYSYGVASTVGLMTMHIIGFSGSEAVPYAIRLGVALQMTNILRDVGEDWRAGRLYLALEDLAKYGLTEADVAAGRVDDRWRAFMQFNIQRTHQLYEESWPGIAHLDRDGRFSIGSAAELYRAILDRIEDNDYDVFTRRAAVGRLDKLSRLPAVWWRARFGLRGPKLARQTGTL